jgi:5'-3' exonuclease
MNFIIIDLSYYIFYRYYALIRWWKIAKPEEELGVPIENQEFVEKFRKTFVEKIREIEKKLMKFNKTNKANKVNKAEPCFIIGAQDCPRLEIWRHKYYTQYKANRGNDDEFMGGPFFKMAYEEILGPDADADASICKTILKHPHLEADDCIALICKYILKTHEEANIYIIANDMDYLQLADEKVQIITLQFKNLQESKHASGKSERDLFNKILLGDKSDNIPPVFAKCGPKTVNKYYEDRELFEKKLDEVEGAREKYERNKKIIDFNEIPTELVDSFMENLQLQGYN